MADYPIINGNAYSWASISFKIDGQADLGIYIKEISYSHKVEREMLRGAGMRPLGFTRGEYGAEGSVTFTREGWNAIISKFGAGYLERSFGVSVSYAELGQNTVTDELVQVRFGGSENNPSQGAEGTEVSCDLHILAIRENGVNPLNSTR